jgi:actin related protein 2/3 complex subunit 3
VSECLGKVRGSMSAREAQKEVQNIALDSNFAIPGDPGFPLNQVCPSLSRLSSHSSLSRH